MNGNLKLADGAVFAGIIPSSVHVTGDVKVGKGALLGLGYATQTDVVDGSVDAKQPLSLYLGFVTVHGDVTSNGGGTSSRFYNFPIKDNTIDGNLTLRGWLGGWIGAIRNTVGGSVDISKNLSVVQAADGDACDASGTFPAGCDAAPGGRHGLDRGDVEHDRRRSELQGQLAGGAGEPARRRPAQLVGGTASGECAGLTTANPCATGTLVVGNVRRASRSTAPATSRSTRRSRSTATSISRTAPSSAESSRARSTSPGDVNVGKGALLGLGYATKTDVVDGSVMADQPLSLYLGFVTVHGDVTSNGGGTAARFYNFPIKDNTIDGNLTLHGWDGGWIGAIRNTVGGNVDISNNVSAVQAADGDACDASGTFPAGCDAVPGGDTDSTEVMTNTISGNLSCKGNSPVAQVNALDGGQPNSVGGDATRRVRRPDRHESLRVGDAGRPGRTTGSRSRVPASVAFNAQVTVNGNLKLADGAVFAGIIPSSVHVTGNVKVGQGALLGLGYATTTDVVDGNIDADQPLSLYLGSVTVHGNVTSNGGGTTSRFYNFPIKDNTIDGNLTLRGWTGGWIGAIRNTVGGSVDFSNNRASCRRPTATRATPRGRSRPAATRRRAVTRTRPR